MRQNWRIFLFWAIIQLQQIEKPINFYIIKHKFRRCNLEDKRVSRCVRQQLPAPLPTNSSAGIAP